MVMLIAEEMKFRILGEEIQMVAAEVVEAVVDDFVDIQSLRVKNTFQN